MRAVILYEAMFGSIEHVATVVADALSDAGADALLAEVRSAHPHDLIGTDLLLIGAPTHAFTRDRGAAVSTRHALRGATARPALGLGEWLALLDHAFPSRTARPPAIVFDTRIETVPRSPGSPARRAARALHAQGFELLAEPMSFYVESLGGPPGPPEADRARRWVEGWAGALLEGESARRHRPTT